MITRRLVIGSIITITTTKKVFSARPIGGPSTKNIPSPATTTAGTVPAEALSDKIVYQGDVLYEPLRQAATFNARKPKRFPPAIVRANNEADVVAAVKLAKQKGWQVTVRSGGHSWSGSHTRDNALQINLSKMQEISYDSKTEIVTYNPGVYGNTVNKMLREQHQRMTPSAHGYNVGMGGFIMSGGLGWNSRLWGIGAANLVALDVVTADGELLHADADQNSDYYWAARGAGPGYFGVAVRYYSKTHPHPTVKRGAMYVYAIDELEEMITWLRNVTDSLPKYMEVVLIGKAPEGKPIIRLIANVLCWSEQDANDAFSILETCPVAPRAIQKKVGYEIQVPYDEESPTDSMPTGPRYAIDNIWTNASAAEMMPYMRKLFTDYPTPQSFAFWTSWGNTQDLSKMDMCYSMQGSVYLSSNAVYYDPAADERMEKWCITAMKRLDKIADGAQMNDENMAGHKARYLSETALKRLETLREKYDPQRIFPGFPKSPS